jgi:uncharacterized membrane protein
MSAQGIKDPGNDHPANDRAAATHSGNEPSGTELRVYDHGARVDAVARSRWYIAIALGIACLGCLGLLGLRSAKTEYFTRGFIWNLFLAAIPFPLAWFTDVLERASFPKLSVIPALGWLAFFPNAPYLVTDVVHLGRSKRVPLWFDGITFGAFGATGLLLGFVSLYLVQSAVRRRLGAVRSYAFAVVSLLLCSYGLYLGRIERWNSWDVVGRPGALANSVKSHFLSPIRNIEVLAITGVIALVLTAGYAIVATFAHLVVMDDRERRL